MSVFTLLDIIPCQNILGEGVQWNPQDNAVWWTDIESSKLYRYHPQAKRLDSWSTPERVGCFAFVQNDDRLLLALANGFAWFNLESGHHTWIAQPEIALKGNRFNDGRVDRQGRFWAGSVVEQASHHNQYAGLYCLDQQQRITQQLSGLSISNSLCWSPDSRKLYHADSPSFSIKAYDFDAATGNVSNPQIFARLPEGVEPDGACIDAEGYLWNAQWGGSQIVRYTPAGVIDQVLSLPVTQPTCVALGGPYMNWLFVTSARKNLTQQELSDQPQAGSLLIYQTDSLGLEENWYLAE